MNKCPSCNRVYSDTVELCPHCGIALGGHSHGGSNENATKVVDEKVVTEEKKKSGKIWKVLTAISTVSAVIFLSLYLYQYSEYDNLERRYNRVNRDYSSMSQEYEEMEALLDDASQTYADLEELQATLDSANQKYNELKAKYDSVNQKYENLNKTVDRYDLDGRYNIEVTSAYNGTEDYEKISDSLKASSLDCLCLEYSLYDYTKSWKTIIYVDIITPSGEIFMPEAENNGHTLKANLSDTTGDVRYRRFWWRLATWETGTYRVVFYQGNRAIDSYEVKVT